MLPGDKTGTQLIKAGEKLGSWLAEIVGSVPEDLVGVIGGDWLHHKRRRHLAQLESNTARILEEVDRSRLSEPSPSMLIPLLQATVDESREQLQDLWAALLANLMIDGGKRVRRAYFETVKLMEPQDVVILQNYEPMRIRGVEMHNSGRQDALQGMRDFFESKLKEMNVIENEYVISTGQLHKLGVITASAFVSGINLGVLTRCRRGSGGN